MLFRFALTNFRSIQDRQEFSLVPSRHYKENPESLLPCQASPTETLLPLAVIYGPNASGKSNILGGVRFLQQMVELSQSRFRPQQKIARDQFALTTEGAKSPTSVEIEFAIDNVRYQYGFDASDEAFQAEWLYSQPHGHKRMLFEREGNDIKFGRELKGQNKQTAGFMRTNSLFLSAAAQNDHEQLTPIFSYLTSFEMLIGSEAPFGLVSDKPKKFEDRIIQFLSAINTGVTCYRSKKHQSTELQTEMERAIETIMKKHIESPEAAQSFAFPTDSYVLELGHRSASEDPVYFPLEQESSGTRRLLVILDRVFSALDNGHPVFIDELSASLHTQVCENILALFSDQRINKKGAQLIGTTHDTNLMRSPLLRRDQIWFTEKNEIGATHLYPLSDIKSRKTDNVERNYLQGRYGAIPFSGDIDLLMRD